MRRTVSILVATAAVALLAGCASPDPAASPDDDHLPATTPAASSTPSPTPTPTDEPDPTYGERIVNDRGNLVKEIGQLSGLGNEEGTVTYAQFAVTDIVPDVECTSGFDDAPKNGHFVGIHLNVETTPELAQAVYGTVSFSEWAWQAFDDTGKRINDPTGTAWSCVDSGEVLPGDIGPAQSVSGWVVLDLPTAHGSVALTLGATTGWEWTY